MVSSAGCVVCELHSPDESGACSRRCRHRRRRVGLLCDGCLERVREDLDDIGQVWSTSAVPFGRPAEPRGSERGLPGGADWLEWRSGRPVLGVLGGWARVLGEDLTTATDAPVAPAARVPDVVAWLRARVESIACREWVADFAAELAAVAAGARRLAGLTEAGLVVRCPGAAGECGRRLRVPSGWRALDAGQVVCRACGSSWSLARLVVVALDAGADVWVDADAAAAVLGVSVSTVRRWSRSGAVRRDHGRYNLGDCRGVLVGGAVHG